MPVQPVTESENFDLRICRQYIKGEALNANEDAEYGQARRLRTRTRLVQVM